jgi:hypothetical protein
MLQNILCLFILFACFCFCFPSSALQYEHKKNIKAFGTFLSQTSFRLEMIESSESENHANNLSVEEDELEPASETAKQGK